jgi:CheY-like chemotaxis protein
MPSGEGLLLRPAPSIHTAFMRFSIDAVFLDANLRVVKLVDNLRPWRTASARRARAVLELKAGEISRRGLELEDRLAVLEPPGAPAGGDLPQPASPDASSASSGSVASRAHVLLVARDRRFRALASALLTRRGYSVAVGDGKVDVAELAVREGADVVVIDASASLTAAAREAARLGTLRPPVGIVAVGTEPQQSLSALPVISKWNSFDALYAAIEQARSDNAPAAGHDGHG